MNPLREKFNARMDALVEPKAQYSKKTILLKRLDTEYLLSRALPSVTAMDEIRLHNILEEIETLHKEIMDLQERIDQLTPSQEVLALITEDFYEAAADHYPINKDTKVDARKLSDQVTELRVPVVKPPVPQLWSNDSTFPATLEELYQSGSDEEVVRIETLYERIHRRTIRLGYSKALNVLFCTSGGWINA